MLAVVPLQRLMRCCFVQLVCLGQCFYKATQCAHTVAAYTACIQGTGAAASTMAGVYTINWSDHGFLLTAFHSTNHTHSALQELRFGIVNIAAVFATGLPNAGELRVP